MRRLARRLLALDQPQETRFFLVIAGWAAFAAVVYWFVSYEIAGTILLAALALASGLAALRLILTWRRRHADLERQPPGTETAAPGTPEAPGPDARDVPGGGTVGIDRPFADPVRLTPEPGLGPFAVGLGLALVAAGTIFGLATVAVGLVPLGWGGLLWLRDATAEQADVDDWDVPDPGG
jgi:hypothetical protein